MAAELVVISREDSFLAPGAGRVYSRQWARQGWVVEREKDRATRIPVSEARRMIRNGRYYGLSPRLESAE